MERFQQVDINYLPPAPILLEEVAVSIYNGDVKTQYESGTAQLTASEVVWTNQKQKLILKLEEIACTEVEKGGFFGKDKVLLHFVQKDVSAQQSLFIKLSIKDGSKFNATINRLLQEESWKKYRIPSTQQSPMEKKQAPRQIVTRSGIVGIERAYEEQVAKTESSIQVAFEDLKKLMQSAEEMVALSKEVSSRISEKKGSITDDETVLFKSYLLTLGIDDPVTRDTSGTSNNYYYKLGQEVESVLLKPVEEAGGLLSLADAYCRLNRARGMVLVSPEDLYKACKTLGPERRLQMYCFPTGVCALQSGNLNSKQLDEETLQALEEKGSQTVESFALILNISVILARERLLSAERIGKVCRDESVAGLRFFPNLFLQKSG